MPPGDAWLAGGALPCGWRTTACGGGCVGASIPPGDGAATFRPPPAGGTAEGGATCSGFAGSAGLRERDPGGTATAWLPPGSVTMPVGLAAAGRVAVG